MSLMLGNQYFMARKYEEALIELSDHYKDNPDDKTTQRKLIICNAITGKLDRALEIFISLVANDVDFILDSDPIRDDCPCPEVVFELEDDLTIDKNSADYYKNLGMLWLYCDLHKSIEQFEHSLELEEDTRPQGIG